MQCRTGSSRLPGKVLAEIAGKPMLARVVERVGRASSIDSVVVATTEERGDDVVVELCRENGVESFRGSSLDVLDRFYQAARRYGLGTVVRVSADCPLIDPEVIDRVMAVFSEGDYDYVSNTLRHTFPDGLDTEVFSFDALERAWRSADSLPDREHVTPFIKRGDGFRLANVESPVQLPERGVRWTVDEPRDLEFARAVYSSLGDAATEAGFEAVLELIDREPGLADINTGIVRYEGYYRSLAAAPAISPSLPLPGGPGGLPVIVRGSGSRVWDRDGHEYIDYCMEGGAAILGHGSTARGLEGEAEAAVLRSVVGMEAVRFLADPGAARLAAIRVARAYTGREIAVWCGLEDESGAPGRSFAYGDLEAAERALETGSGEIAVVMIEPTGTPGTPNQAFLRQVRELTKGAGALLAFDETVSAFRLAPGGASEFFGVTADISCFGPSLAGGRPVSALGGRRAVVELARADGEVDGETLGAIAATAETIRQTGVIEHLWEQGTKLRDGFNVLAEQFGVADRAACVGLPPRSVFDFGADSDAGLFREECLRRGVLFGGIHNVSAAHSDADVDYTLQVYRSALDVLARSSRTS